MRLELKRAGLVCAAVAGSLVARSADAQKNPFPTSGHYARGYAPSATTAATALSSYKTWKSNYLVNDCGGTYYRVDNGNRSTFSEGQGYGMVLTAYFGDRARFDGLWAFAQKSFNSSGMMGWHVNCSGFSTSDGGSGSATDGDEDIGFALVVAAAQWGGTYLQTAKSYLATLKNVDFATCLPSGRNVPAAGNWQGKADACTTAGKGTNTSYWTPAYSRVFQDDTGDPHWGKAADDVVALYKLAANPTTGIIVNEVDQNGAPVIGQTYDYNSCRIPWRAALDYLWFGTPGAQEATTKMTNWANTVSISNIVDGYNANGTATGKYTGLNAFVGGFAVGAMSSSQNVANAFASYFVSVNNTNGGYYGSSLRTLYLLTLSGNQWNPSRFLGPVGGATAGAGSTTTEAGTPYSEGPASLGEGTIPPDAGSSSTPAAANEPAVPIHYSGGCASCNVAARARDAGVPGSAVLALLGVAAARKKTSRLKRPDREEPRAASR